MTVGSFSELMVFSAIMGFSIFLSLPIIFAKKMGQRSIVLLTSIAVGILTFLLADIFSDVAGSLYPAGSYIANPVIALIFVMGVGVSFFLLFALENHIKTQDGVIRPMHISLIIAIAIGFQNLTEGLVFGANWNAGITGLLLVIFAGFVLQNFTEGFPIISPFLGEQKPKLFAVSLLFSVGAFPTILGSVAGYYFTSGYLNVAFDSFAIGTIFYVIIPMLRSLFKHSEKTELSPLLFIGLMTGFLGGFLVNII